MTSIAEKARVGRYCCTNCGRSHELGDFDDRLALCGNCGGGWVTTYRGAS
jgi:ribosomal protein S27AE